MSSISGFQVAITEIAFTYLCLWCPRMKQKVPFEWPLPIVRGKIRRPWSRRSQTWSVWLADSSIIKCLSNSYIEQPNHKLNITLIPHSFVKSRVLWTGHPFFFTFKTQGITCTFPFFKRTSWSSDVTNRIGATSHLAEVITVSPRSWCARFTTHAHT